MEVLSVSPARAIIKCTPEEFAQCKRDGYVDNGDGSSWKIERFDEQALTIVAVPTISSSFTLPVRRP